MSLEISCPGCQQSVPLADDPLAEQTCPHCQAVFRLQAVLVETASEETNAADFLAAVSATESPPAASPSGDSESPTEENDTPEEPPAPEETAGTEQETPEEPSFAQAATALTGEDAEASATGENQEAEEASAEKSLAEAEEQSEDAEAAISLAQQDEEDSQEQDEQEDYWASLEQADTGEEEHESLTEKARSLSRRQGPSPLVHLLGIIGSGFLGLAIGYYVLNYVGGPRFNFLNIPLPGIPHTQQNDTAETPP